MSYLPQVPVSGIAGWRILNRTEATQKAAFDKSADVKADVAYFTENIGKVTSAADLMADRRLLKVALGAFGLGEEINKKAFIRKVLEEGTTEKTAIANKLTETGFKKLSAAFGFGDAGGSNTGDSGFAASITEAYKTRAFEAAVGESDSDMRLAMNFRREITDLAAGETGGSWFSVIGSKSLSKVIVTGFGLPASSFGKLDVDRQREILREKCDAMFGSPDLSVFQDAEKVGKLIDRFLARSQIENGSTRNTSAAASALTLLGGGMAGSQGIYNLLISRS